MAQLPIVQSTDQAISTGLRRWKAQLDPVLANPLNDALVISNVALVSGDNVINHGLGQQQQGWFIVDIQGIADIYRSAPFNSKTLTLTSDASVTISLAVF